MEARGRARTLAALAVVAWIAYEIVMAWRLRDTFTVNDWLALAWKLVYLTGLLAAVALGGLEVAARYAALESTILAALVRASHGWLSYTWFTVLVPAIGVAASLHLYRRRGPGRPLPTTWPGLPTSSPPSGAGPTRRRRAS